MKLIKYIKFSFKISIKFKVKVIPIEDTVESENSSTVESR